MDEIEVLKFLDALAGEILAYSSFGILPFSFSRMPVWWCETRSRPGAYDPHPTQRYRPAVFALALVLYPLS